MQNKIVVAKLALLNRSSLCLHLPSKLGHYGR